MTSRPSEGAGPARHGVEQLERDRPPVSLAVQRGGAHLQRERHRQALPGGRQGVAHFAATPRSAPVAGQRVTVGHRLGKVARAHSGATRSKGEEGLLPADAHLRREAVPTTPMT